MANMKWGQQTSFGRSAKGSLNRPGQAGRKTVERELLLDLTAYVTGGWKITQADSQMTTVFDLEMLCSYDPLGRKVDQIGVQPFLVKNGAGHGTKIQLFYNGVERGNGLTFAAGQSIWLRFIGV